MLIVHETFSPIGNSQLSNRTRTIDVMRKTPVTIDEIKNKEILLVDKLTKIAETIKELDETGKWTFSFLGADLDAVSASDNLNIRRENIISFSKGNYDKVMHQMSSSIRNYENMKSAGNMKSNLFDDIDEKDQRNFTK